MTVVLIAINLIISLMAFSAFRHRDRAERFLLVPYEVARGKNYLGMVLSQFSHADFGHLFFNMITLYFFAPVVQYIQGSVSLIIIYAVSGFAASILTIVFHRNNPTYRALGASGSVSGVIFASIVIYPSASIYLFFIPIPIPGPVFAMGYVALSIYLAKRQMGNIGHEAHIGGAVSGFILAGLLSDRGYGPLLDRIREMLS